MQLEFHQRGRRWEHLRVRHPARQRRLPASLAECGQQVPIVVVAAEGQADQYMVIDGYKRIAALEVGWLLAELEQRFGYRLEELARRFDRSPGGHAATAAKPGKCMPSGAGDRPPSASAFWTIRRCSSKRSGRRKLRPGLPPN